MTLREYEQEWLTQAHQDSSTRKLLVGPTGAGKTVVAVEIVKKAINKRQRVLVIAHRRELIVQAHERMVAGGVHPYQIGVVLSVIAADEPFERNPDAWIQIATLQSLARRDREDLPRADVIVVDEAHHVPADSYAEVLSSYPFAIVYGLTATPFRSDGRGLAPFFDSIVPCAPPSKLIKQGFLAKPRIFTVAPEHRPRLLGVRKRDGDYDQAALARVTDLPHLIGSLTGHYKRHAEDRLAVAYGVSIAHCEHIAASFNKAGIRAATIFGSTPLNERLDYLNEFKEGKYRVIVNCQVLTEGWDCPEARCAIIAVGTLSPNKWFQMVGRVTRPGPVTPIVLDHAGNAIMHGLPLEDVRYTLNDRVHTGTQGAGEKRCPRCESAVANGSQTCPWCAYQWWNRDELPEVATHARLVPVNVKLERRCSYESCPTPHIPVRSYQATRAREEEILHYACKTLRARARRRKCEHPNCLTPDEPLLETNKDTMHKACRVAPVRTLPCSHCQKPLQVRGNKPSPMHLACQAAVALSRRKCQYDKCQTPDLPLSHKAHQQGVRMHRPCAARARSERIAPDRPRCEICGKVRNMQHKLISGRWCPSCFASHKMSKKGNNERGKPRDTVRTQSTGRSEHR